ncbi:MAG: dephospho-CoA kinase [Bacillota bacterium]
MKIIGLTGDAGSGKSAVARILAELGATVLDADRVARRLTEPGTPVLAEIARVFGRGILKPDGALDRPRLAARVFTDPEERDILNRIIHPPVQAILEQEIAAARDGGPGVLVVEVPLLLETGLDKLVDEVWLTVADPEVKLERLKARGLTPEVAAGILAAQMPQELKTEHAHRIIDTNGSLTRTRQQVIKYWTEIKPE